MIKPWLKFNTGLMALCAVVLVACNENETPIDPGTGTAPNAPTALMAQSQSQAVGLKWTVSSTGATPTSYVIEYNEAGTTTMLTKTVSSATATTATVDGLTNGVVYEFVVYAMNGTAKSPASPKVSWAPAKRGTGAYRLYSSRNSTQGSGLGIFREGGGAPVNLTTSAGGQWDIAFDDVTASDPRIGSPGQSQYLMDDGTYRFKNHPDQVAREVYLGGAYEGVTSLDDIYETAALTIPTTGGESMVRLTTLTGTGNYAFVIGSKSGTEGSSVNFAKVLVKRGANGQFVQGSGADAYVDVEVSYQTMPNVPYALKQRIEQVGLVRANGGSQQSAR